MDVLFSMKRSHFLHTATGLLSGSLFAAPFKAPLLPLTNPSLGVKIKAVKPYVFPQACYVKVETDAGISGWGEGDHDYTALTAQMMQILVKEGKILGKDPFDSERLWHNMYFEGLEAGTTGLMPGALAGLDNALWDLKGKLLQLPVYKLLGGSGVEKVRAYGSYPRRYNGDQFKTPAEMAAQAVAFVEQGYQTVKARMQIRESHKNPAPSFTYDCVKAIRQAVGDGIELFVDFNNGYTAQRAIQEGLRLYEHFNVQVIEEPVSPHDYAGLEAVSEALPCAVNAGEHEYNKWQFRDLITVGKVDTLNLDLIKCGGITECRKVAHLAQAFEREIMVHNTRPTLATAASLHLCASITNAARVQEYAGTRPDLKLEGLFDNTIRFENGYLYVPQEPGLGLRVNEAEMERRKIN